MNLAPHLLLCERCGYPLDEILGTPGVTLCPECGTPVAESMPERRVGSPWQRRASFLALLQTWWAIARRPSEAWRIVRAEGPPEGASQLGTTCNIAGLLLVLPYLVDALRHESPFDLTVLLEFGAVLLIGLMIGLLLMVLSRVERLGIQFFGRQRGWRVADGVAKAVIGHASVGWLVIPAVFNVAVLVRAGIWVWAKTTGRWARPPLMIDVYLLVAFGVGALAGLLAFETLVYIGVRRMRFANAPRPRRIPGAA